MNNDKCMGPIGDLGAKPISKAKRESSATDKAADEKARQGINRMTKHSK